MKTFWAELANDHSWIPVASEGKTLRKHWIYREPSGHDDGRYRTILTASALARTWKITIEKYDALQVQPPGLGGPACSLHSSSYLRRITRLGFMFPLSPPPAKYATENMSVSPPPADIHIYPQAHCSHFRNSDT